MAEPDRLRAPVIREGTRRLTHEQDGVLDSGEGFVIEQRALERPATGIAENEELTRQIPAVHRGDVAGLQRTKVGRLIPVVEVTPEALEPAHRRECRLHPVDGLQHPEPAEITGGDCRPEVESDVGRRRTVGENGRRVLLEVVRRQVRFAGTDERLEEPPRAACGRAEEPRIRRRQPLRRVDARGPADPSRDERREGPQQEERHGDRPGAWPNENDQQPGHDGQDQRPTHPSIGAGQGEGQSRFGVRGRHPFEQPSMGPVHADQRPSDRIAHEPGLVRHERDPERNLGGRPTSSSGRPRGCGPVWRYLISSGSPRQTPARRLVSRSWRGRTSSTRAAGGWEASSRPQVSATRPEPRAYGGGCPPSSTDRSAGWRFDGLRLWRRLG